MEKTTKKIVLNDYYSTLSPVQKRKHAEKQGMLCYYEWLDTLTDECTPEEAGYVFLALLHFDRFGGSVELPSYIEEKLLSDSSPVRSSSAGSRSTNASTASSAMADLMLS